MMRSLEFKVRILRTDVNSKSLTSQHLAVRQTNKVTITFSFHLNCLSYFSPTWLIDAGKSMQHMPIKPALRISTLTHVSTSEGKDNQLLLSGLRANN